MFIPLRLFLGDFAAFAGAKRFAALLFILLGAFVEGIGLALLIPFFSVLTESQDSGSWIQHAAAWLFSLFTVETRVAKLGLLVALLAVLMIARCIIVVARDVTMAELAIGFIQHLRSRITHRLAVARWSTVSKLRHSRITHLMSADIQQFELATSLLMHDAVAAVMLASQIVLAFLIAPLLAALTLSVVLIGVVALLPMMRRAQWFGRVVTDANLSLIDDMTQFLGALKLAISQNLQNSFTREFDNALCELKTQELRYIRRQTLARLIVTTSSGIVGAVLILLGLAVFDVSASVLITLLLILSRMSGPAVTLQLEMQQIARALPAYEKIRTLEDELIAAEALPDMSTDRIVNVPNGPIMFRGVFFSHDPVPGAAGAGGLVRNLNMIIQPGSVVGITGPSGAGKTTFADLLVSLYSPQSGEILIGGVPLRGPLVTAWRNSVGYVAQDAFLFHDTIRRNLLWVNPEANEFALWNALRIVGAEQIVRNAKRGLDTLVGERGSLISGGERQRLCLARALLRRPRLLVLDEATSAIDVEGEQELFDRLLKLSPCPTIVLIAHRPETLRRCQRILCFEAGELISDTSSQPSAPITAPAS